MRVDGNPNEAGHTVTTGVPNSDAPEISYETVRVVGNGSFGVVFQATQLETGDTVAIKKVLQDKRFKNRELQIMKMMDHVNVVRLKHCFYSTNDAREVYLNLVLEFVPDTVHRIGKHYSKSAQRVPSLYVKLYTYQMARALANIHKSGVCHRDIKPQNLLVDTTTHQLKLCDFGSAKVLRPDEPNISYICSRYYRAPELIFGATQYTTAIDMWSLGCVMAELILGSPLFPGESGVDQLVEIIKVLGTPTREQIRDMNPSYTEFKFPQIKSHPWSKVFHKRLTPDALDLIGKLLVYSPATRCTGLEACAHAYFDELRDPATRLPNGRPLPPLFDFSDDELSCVSPELAAALVPPHARGVGAGGGSDAKRICADARHAVLASEVKKISPKNFPSQSRSESEVVAQLFRMSSWREATRVDENDHLRRGSVWLGRPPRACVRRTSAMPRSDRSPGEYSSHRGTPKKGPPSDRSSDYDSEDDDGPTLFGSILRTLMAGGAVVAIAVLVRVASAFHGRPRVSPSKASRTTRVAKRARTREPRRAASPERTARSSASRAPPRNVSASRASPDPESTR